MNTNGFKQEKHNIGLKFILVIAVAAMLMWALAGTMASPAMAAPPKITTISWVEVGYRYSYDGTLQAYFQPETIGPLEFLQTGRTYHAESLADFYSIPVSDIKGSMSISGPGNLSAEITYIRFNSPLLLKDLITGRVTVDPDAGTMTGTYIQYRQAYGTRAEVLEVYPYAIPDKSPDAKGWWFLDYTIYDVTEN